MNAVEQQREEIVESIQTLPDEVLHKLASFVEYLRHKVDISATQQQLTEESTPRPTKY